ncbi:MAG: PAS domain-containing hybrid sensor histidine kinase/response regulator, partial [Myxococcales bacterium]
AELTLRSDLPGCGPTLCLQCRKLARQPDAPGTPPWLVQHYERLVRLSPALSVVANATHYELVSPAWQKVLGYSEEEMLRRPFNDFVHPDDVPLTVACVVSLIEHEELIESFENRFIRRDGAVLNLHWSAIYDPDMQRIYAVAYDVTEQRALQARLSEASKAAEQASRAKSQFLANTSHEIRTPLNAILNANELLLTTTLDDEQRELVEIALLAGRGLQGLLSNVLDLSRIESGRLELEQSAFDPRRPLDETLRAQRNRALDQGLDLELHLSPDVPARIVGDELRLRQIVGNLVDNALKFTTRGCVSVHLGTVRGDLWLCVRDTGVGIAPEKLGHIFEPFTQADVSDTRRHGGAGLGLTICREFVTRMGGTIRVDSRPGVGTTFEVQLPMVVPPA